MTARELERLTQEAFGQDFRDKAIVGPLDRFRLADVFDECGLRDPERSEWPRSSYGLWQFCCSNRFVI